MLNEIEIAVITYNRASILEKWINIMLKQVINYNILLSIYDSSNNDDTRILIECLNRKLSHEKRINYVHLDSDIRVDEKVLESILRAKRMYIWPVGDSRVFNLDDLAQELTAMFNLKIGYISLYDTPSQYNGKIYSDPVVFFKELFWRSTLLGGLIFKREIFEALRNDAMKTDYMEKFNRNDGFSHLGIFYDLIVKHPGYDGIFLILKFDNVVSKKKPAWIHRYMDVWCDNLCYLIDQLPFNYNLNKKYVLKTTWKDLNLDGWQLLLMARINNGLNYSIYKKYKNTNLLEKVSEKELRIAFVSMLPVPIAKMLVLFIKIYGKLKFTLERC